MNKSPWITCNLGCGFSHVAGDPKPRHNPVWLLEELTRLTNEVNELQTALAAVRNVNNDLHLQLKVQQSKVNPIQEKLRLLWLKYFG